MPGDASGMQPRGYSWPPFEPGNKAAVRHGAYSVEVYGPIARELVTGVLVDRPQLARYRTAVAAWADLEARCLVIREHLNDHGMLADGEPRAAMDLLLKLERQADKARQRLGLDPKADADLARSRLDAERHAVDLEAIQAAGRAALESGERAEVVGTEREELADVEEG